MEDPNVTLTLTEIIAGVAISVIAAGVFGIFRLNKTIVRLDITLRMVEKELADHEQRLRGLERPERKPQ